jgi:hypothetical protein
MCAPEQVKRGALRGYYAGDGCATRRSVKTVSRTVVDQVSILSTTLGVRPAAYAAPAYAKEGVTRQRAYCVRFRKTAPRLVDGYGLHRVRAARLIPFSGDVYNLTVREDHSYIAGGVAVHNCGTSGTLAYIFAEAAKGDSYYAEACKFVAENDGPSLSAALGRLERDRAVDGVLSEVPTEDWLGYASRCGRVVPAYLVERGIVRDDVKRWRLGFDEGLQRAVFPVWDHRKRVVGCLRRAVYEDQDPKYYDTPGADSWKKRVFYGEHRVDPTIRVAYLVEGPMDVIFPGRFLPNVLGMMGSSTGIEGERLVKLRSWADVLVFLFDPDKGGRKAVHGFVNPKGKVIPGLRAKLRRYFTVKEGVLPDGYDPCELVRYDPTMLQEVIRRARYLGADKPLTSESQTATVSEQSKVRGYLLQKQAMTNKPSMKGVNGPDSGT